MQKDYFKGWNKPKTAEYNLSNKNNISSNKRNYDKEPLIIKNYHMFCNYCIIFSMGIAFVCSFYIFNPNFDKYKDNDKKDYTTHRSYNKGQAVGNTISSIAGFISSFKYIFPRFKYLFEFLSVAVGMFLLMGYYYIVTLEYLGSIKFTNKYIEFIEDDKKSVRSEGSDITRSFSSFIDFGLYNPKTTIIVMMLIAISLCFVFKSKFLIMFITYLILLIPSQIFVNFLIYCIFNKGIRGFKIFPYIKIGKATRVIEIKQFLFFKYKASSYEYAIKDTAIFIYNNEIYKELKEYFLTTRNIDIDKAKRYYFVF